MRNLLLLFSFLLIYPCTSLQAQDEVWRTLFKVGYDKVVDKDLGYEVMYPIFPEEVMALNGKEITITGYIIPLEDDIGYFAFSAFPYENCFFCGNAGMETVMEVYAKKPLKYSPKAITIRGKLKINEEDIVSHLMYILEDAVLVN
ncbi:MAG: hypothetical protein AAGI38_23315 [Bacteroidota bacterium]